MKLTPKSTARRRTAIAAARSLGGPQIPSPVRRMAPKPRRLTVSSPPREIVPLLAADWLVVFSLIFILQDLSLLDVAYFTQRCASSNPGRASSLLRVPSSSTQDPFRTQYRFC